MKIKFKKLHPDAKIPSFAHSTDAGMDLYAIKKVAVNPSEYVDISLGVSAEIPEGYFVSIRDKSGLAVKYGIHTMGGVIDSGFRGEWKVLIVNLGAEKYTFETGDKVAQAIVHKIPRVKIVEVKHLSVSERGNRGFGSTGKK